METPNIEATNEIIEKAMALQAEAAKNKSTEVTPVKTTRKTVGK